MFKETSVRMFMGGEFSITDMLESTPELADLFQSWADEVKGWGDEELSEVEIVKGRIVVTLKDGKTG